MPAALSIHAALSFSLSLSFAALNEVCSHFAFSGVVEERKQKEIKLVAIDCKPVKTNLTKKKKS